MKKRIFAALITAVFAAAGFAAVFAAAYIPEEITVATGVPAGEFIVAIDAGHGGIDAGVSGVKTKVKESDLNLEIAKNLAELFEAGGIKIVMTRTSAAGLYGVLSKGFKLRDMKKRMEIINTSDADIMISVHLNHFDMPSRRGGQVFYKAGSERGKLLAESIQSEFNGREEQPRAFEPLAGDYYVLNESVCPSVICECGFLSNEEDETLLLTDEYRRKVAYLIFKGAIGYLLSQ